MNLLKKLSILSLNLFLILVYNYKKKLKLTKTFFAAS